MALRLLDADEDDVAVEGRAGPVRAPLRGLDVLPVPLDLGRAGHLAVGDGVMVIAGMYGAALHDGKEWQTLVDLVDLYKRYGRE